jgi:PEP-CTERM putative exosortase interaction domain
VKVISRIVSILVATMTLSGVAHSAKVAGYDGYTWDQTYRDFAAAYYTLAGNAFQNLSKNFAKSDLDDVSLIVLISPPSFDIAQINILSDFVHSGGRLVLQSDNISIFEARDNSNAILKGIGSGIRDSSDSFDPDAYSVTSDIIGGPFTAGVSNIEYAYSSNILGGNTLVKGVSGQNLVAYEAIGSGYVFAISDFNTVRDLVRGNYGNRTLYSNFLTATVPSQSQAVPEPTTWIMFILGFGLIGYTVRQNKRSTLPARI